MIPDSEVRMGCNRIPQKKMKKNNKTLIELHSELKTEFISNHQDEHIVPSPPDTDEDKIRQHQKLLTFTMKDSSLFSFRKGGIVLSHMNLIIVIF